MSRSQAQALAAYSMDADLRAAKARIGEALPDDGWIHDYLEAVTPLTDAPVEFHLASGLCAIAAALGNNLRVESWGQNVFPHLWAVLVAPSSFWRKSTSINTAEALLHAAVPGATLPSEFSREALLGNLAKQPAGMFALKEFGGFLSMLGRDYMTGAKENLTELYDGPELFTRVLKKDTIEIRRPAITILGATTLDWLEAKITDGDLRGGFLARFLFVTAREKASGKGITQGMEPGARIRLVSGLRSICDAPGGLATYGPGALELLNDWMHGWEAEVGRTHHRSDLSGFAVRLQTYALKLAMVYRASTTVDADDASGAVLDELSVRQAIAYCRVLWANVSGLIDDDIAITREAKELRRIRGIIGEGITRSQALKLSKMKARDFDQYLETLVQGGEIVSTKARASEVGIERQRDSQVQWLTPVHRNGSNPGAAVLQFPGSRDDAEGLEFTGIPSEPEGTAREGELQGTARANSLSESSSSSLSSSSPSHESIDTYTRGELEPENSKDDDADDDPVGLL